MLVYCFPLRKGDPYVKVDQGYARLPGAGYKALHPELKGTNPEDYPDIHKLVILADVAPYSREYNTSLLSGYFPEECSNLCRASMMQPLVSGTI
jgi:hypothetical protein